MIVVTYENLDQETFKYIQSFQQDEINSHIIYGRLAERVKDEHNSKILKHISEDELKHYNTFKSFTKKDIKKQRLKILFYYWVTIIFGLTFGIRLMERGEEDAQEQYKRLSQHFPPLIDMLKDETRHESELIDMLNDELLTYVSSIVLGLSDALVELTGALAGFTFSLGNSNVIAAAGIIVGVSAACSMAASEYLSQSEEKTDEGEAKSPFKASIYTGGAYLLVVIILIIPFIALKFTTTDSMVTKVFPLVITLVFAVIIILVFTYYTTIAKNTGFWPRFFKMAGLSLAVAIFTLFLGFAANAAFGISA